MSSLTVRMCQVVTYALVQLDTLEMDLTAQVGFCIMLSQNANRFHSFDTHSVNMYQLIN